MAELLQPIGELSSAMANVEVPDSVAEAALAEVLKSAGQEDVGYEPESNWLITASLDRQLPKRSELHAKPAQRELRRAVWRSKL